MTTETLIWLIPLPPVLAFFLIVLLTNKNKALSHTLAVGAAFLSWLGSMIVFVRALGVEHLGQHPFESSVDWLPLGATVDTHFKIGVLVDPLTAAVLFFVAWTVLMIFLYSVGYHNFGQPKGDHDHPGLPPHGATVEEHGHKHMVPSVEPMYSRFFAFIGLFAFGMYVLVLSDNLLTLFVGWHCISLLCNWDTFFPRDFHRTNSAHPCDSTKRFLWFLCRRLDWFTALYWNHRQICTVPPACLVARRDGRSDPRQRDDPCRDNGLRRC